MLNSIMRNMLNLLEYAESDFISCRLKAPFLSKFGPKNQNLQFKLRFGTQPNSTRRNSMVIFTFSVVDRKHPFFGESVPKIQNCLWKLKFRTQTNLNMYNLMVILIFFFFRLEIPFLGYFCPKIQNCQFKLEFGTMEMQTISNV